MASGDVRGRGEPGEAAASKIVKPPYVVLAPAALECRLWKNVELPAPAARPGAAEAPASYTMVIGARQARGQLLLSGHGGEQQVDGLGRDEESVLFVGRGVDRNDARLVVLCTGAFVGSDERVRVDLAFEAELRLA